MSSTLYLCAVCSFCFFFITPRLQSSSTCTTFKHLYFLLCTRHLTASLHFRFTTATYITNRLHPSQSPLQHRWSFSNSHIKLCFRTYAFHFSVSAVILRLSLQITFPLPTCISCLFSFFLLIHACSLLSSRVNPLLLYLSYCPQLLLASCTTLHIGSVFLFVSLHSLRS